MRRSEFTRKTKAEAAARAMGLCESCGLRVTGRYEYDHVTPDALGGDNSLENCRAICSKCHKAKTANDVAQIRKADRQRDRNSGAFKARTTRKMQSRGFSPGNTKPALWRT